MLHEVGQEIYIDSLVGKSLIQTRNPRDSRPLTEDEGTYTDVQVHSIVLLAHYDVHGALEQHNILTFITDSSCVIHCCTWRNHISPRIVTKALGSFPSYPAPVLLTLAESPGEDISAGGQGGWGSWMVSIIFPMEYYSLLSVIYYLFVNVFNFSCDF